MHARFTTARIAPEWLGERFVGHVYCELEKCLVIAREGRSTILGVGLMAISGYAPSTGSFVRAAALSL